MTPNLSECLVIGISSRALFDLEQENSVFERQGVDAYMEYQRLHENDILQPGTAFHLIQSLLSLNEILPESRLVEVIVMSQNSPDISPRIFKSIEAHGLDINRASFSTGRRISQYLHAFDVDLFLSRSEPSVREALESGVAGAVLYDTPDAYEPETSEIRIAFDGDAVLFSGESDAIAREYGLDAFHEFEKTNEDQVMADGPFAKVFRILSYLQKHASDQNVPQIRLALVTARSRQAHNRVIKTLRKWDVHLDEAFFMGGLPKTPVLRAFRPHIFFDDQDHNVAPASKAVPSGRVPE